MLGLLVIVILLMCFPKGRSIVKWGAYLFLYYLLWGAGMSIFAVAASMPGNPDWLAPVLSALLILYTIAYLAGGIALLWRRFHRPHTTLTTG